MNDMHDAILAVDDEPGILKVYEDLLSPRVAMDLPRSSRGEAPPVDGFAVRCTLTLADSGEQAVRLATGIYHRGGSLCACFVDMRMPGGIDGLETVRQLRALDPRILVTFVTAYQDRSLSDIGGIFGPQAQDEWDFLNKPFTRSEIIQKATNMLAGWSRRRENEALTVRLKSANEDLTRRAAELQEARQHLLQSEKLASIGRLASGVAHELNNPLTSVIGYTHLALQSDDLNSQRVPLERVADQATRAAGIVRNLLSFARKQEPEKRHLQLNEVIVKSIQLREYELKVANITVHTEMAPDLPKTMLDSNQLQQVFVNLLTNAEQAMVGHGRVGAIRIDTRLRDGRIEAVISDEGPGIAESALPHVFDPFFTTKDAGRGTGLGLSICYGIVLEHGGDIKAFNRAGGGASFAVSLPVLEDVAGDRARPVAPAGGRRESAPVAGRTALPGLKILLVDDEPMILDFARTVLTQPGHAVVTAPDGEVALRRAEEEEFDLVITDVKMPRMGGVEFVRALLSRRPEMSGRVLFASGDVPGAAGICDPILAAAPRLQKPFSRDDLLAAVGAFEACPVA
ncbi:MAG: response regulator [Acidobacteria bacterium]|nr:response regulator [Acidobacteriota bacterium]